MDGISSLFDPERECRISKRQVCLSVVTTGGVLEEPVSQLPPPTFLSLLWFQQLRQMVRYTSVHSSAVQRGCCPRRDSCVLVFPGGGGDGREKRHKNVWTSFFFFFFPESLLEKLPAVHHVMPTALQIPLHGQQGPAPNTEKIQLEHYNQLSSKIDDDLLKTVGQAPLLQPKFWLWLHVWNLIRAIWTEMKAGLGQKGGLQNRPVLTWCDWLGSTLGYCIKTLQSLHSPLCVLWTGKQSVRATLHKPLKTQALCDEVWLRLCAQQWLEIERCYVAFFLILVFHGKVR